MTLPLDNGFLRRECPFCIRQFKWHSGPTDDRPEDAIDPPVYFCPYCGESAQPDQWWTKEQIEYTRKFALIEGSKIVKDKFKDLEKKSRDSFIKIKVGNTNEPEPPSALHEPNDMTLVQSPCHPWEPFKVLDDWSEPLHCLVCGERFTI